MSSHEIRGEKKKKRLGKLFIKKFVFMIKR